MKVIDILNKIANGEEVRFKVCEGLYHCYKYSNLYDEHAKIEARWYLSEDWLNEEVEIIEEDKKIERIKIDDELVDEKTVLTDIGLQRNLIKLTNKINEIIDYINKE